MDTMYNKYIYNIIYKNVVYLYLQQMAIVNVFKLSVERETYVLPEYKELISKCSVMLTLQILINFAGSIKK